MSRNQQEEDDPHDESSSIESLNDAAGRDSGVQTWSNEEGPAVVSEIPEGHDDVDASAEWNDEAGIDAAAQNSTQQQQSEESEHWPEYCDPFYRMPTELAVRVEGQQGDSRVLVVLVEKCTAGSKPYLGGYRQRQSGRQYHHAGTQFGRRERIAGDKSHLRSRNTQTVKVSTCSAQTRRECGTQMERPDLHLDGESDAPRAARPYISADDYWQTREQSVVTMQRYWRGHSARRRVWRLKERRWERTVTARDAAAAARASAEAARARETRRRQNPRTAADFELLYNELHSWREGESARISALPAAEDGGAAKRAAMAALLRKETRLLQTIGRLKAGAAKDGDAARVGRMLALMAQPKRWELGDAEPDNSGSTGGGSSSSGPAGRKVVEVHTPWTHRAKELQALFAALQAPLQSTEDRLDVLLHVKWTVQEFDCRLTRELAELIDREADLLNRGRSDKRVAGLRQRIRSLFLRFVETPDFNPECSRFMKAPPRYQHLTTEATKHLLGVVC
jgi:IQ calmodulin-binding motif